MKDKLAFIVCGGRRMVMSLEKARWLVNLIEELKPDVVFTGGARGADREAAVIVKDFKVPHVAVSAEWKKYGDSAGPIRNKKMLERALDRAERVIVLAYPGGPGTQNMKSLALKQNVEVIDFVSELD